MMVAVNKWDDEQGGLNIFKAKRRCAAKIFKESKEDAEKSLYTLLEAFLWAYNIKTSSLGE